MTFNYEKDIADIWGDLYYGYISLNEALKRAQNSASISLVSINCTPTCNLHC